MQENGDRFTCNHRPHCRFWSPTNGWFSSSHHGTELEQSSYSMLNTHLANQHWPCVCPGTIATSAILSITKAKPNMVSNLLVPKSLSCCRSILGAYNWKTEKHHHHFRAAFDLPPCLVGKLWKDIACGGFLDHLGPRSLHPVHLLWTLLFLKCYSKQGEHQLILGQLWW